MDWKKHIFHIILWWYNQRLEPKKRILKFGFANIMGPLTIWLVGQLGMDMCNHISHAIKAAFSNNKEMQGLFSYLLP